MGVINVRDYEGALHTLEAIEGWRVMEILRDHGMGIEGLCGGACACATCHVRVAPEWINRIHPKQGDEEEMLDEVPVLSENSRLSCQIIYCEELDGLEVELVQQEAA